MRLMLLRHAKAEKAEPGERDHDRALNARGHKDAARMGAYLGQACARSRRGAGIDRPAHARDLGRGG